MIARIAQALASLLALLGLTRLLRRLRRGEREETPLGVVTLLALLSTAGSLGFVVAYVLGGGTQVEGAALATALLAFGLGMVILAARGLPDDLVEEPWEPPKPPPEDREELQREMSRLPRRGFLSWLLRGAAGALGLAIVVPIASLGSPRAGARGETAWRAGARLVTRDGEPVALTSMERGRVITVFPEGHERQTAAQVMLIDTGRPGPDRLVAYSRLCTHAGCPVGLYQEQGQLLLCPCHQSMFDVLDGARPIQGPAARPLPALPIDTGPDGTLRATGPLSGPPGPGWWRHA